MQTHGERWLINQLMETLGRRSEGDIPCRILNIGAGKSVVIEQALGDGGLQIVCDRIDVVECSVDHSLVAECWTGSVESMPQATEGRYDAAFANYVLEHVGKIDEAAKEICRVLRPGGIFIASLANTAAPEFQISKRTPHWFHKMVRGQQACETSYAYASIGELRAVFESAGLRTIETKYFPAVGNYLSKFPIVAALGKGYDKIIDAFNNETLLGDVCVTFGKK